MVFAALSLFLLSLRSGQIMNELERNDGVPTDQKALLI